MKTAVIFTTLIVLRLIGGYFKMDINEHFNLLLGLAAISSALIFDILDYIAIFKSISNGNSITKRK